MAYLKPPMLTRRVFNSLAMRTGIGGAVTLIVPGRRTRETRAIPVIPVEHGDARYLVSTRGESEWVRNVRAASEVELRGKTGSQRFRAVEVPVPQRASIIAAYQKVAGKSVASYFVKLPDPADHPVFAIEPLDEKDDGS